jgi:hypothetical protein
MRDLVAETAIVGLLGLNTDGALRSAFSHEDKLNYPTAGKKRGFHKGQDHSTYPNGSSSRR